MKSFAKKSATSKGASLVEYTLLIAIISIFSIGSINKYSERVSAKYTEIENALANSGGEMNNSGGGTGSGDGYGSSGGPGTGDSGNGDSGSGEGNDTGASDDGSGDVNPPPPDPDPDPELTGPTRPGR